MGAISLDVDGKSVVNQDECVECGAFNPARAESLLERMRERSFLYSRR